MADKDYLKTVSSVFSEHKAKPILKLRYFAVLALLTEVEGELHLVFNKRAAGVNQPGDICFPGWFTPAARLLNTRCSSPSTSVSSAKTAK